MYNFAKYIYIIFTSLLYPVEVSGIENIPKEGPILIVGNHKHLYDQCLAIISTKRKGQIYEWCLEAKI